MKLACVVLRKKGGHGGARVCLCAFLKVLTSASNSSENVCHTVRGCDAFARGGRERKMRETVARLVSNILEGIKRQ